ncbi:receptor-type tyrosine-protein phosphatase F-like [Panulirus ornatus]|uniref:receptor-type tyrosine-protein phosphatase F-like n=1 Tax=Panulirus ornatus TaxID=150431 RepID=UPI003A873E8C
MGLHQGYMALPFVISVYNAKGLRKDRIKAKVPKPRVVTQIRVTRIFLRVSVSIDVALSKDQTVQKKVEIFDTRNKARFCLNLIRLSCEDEVQMQNKPVVPSPSRLLDVNSTSVLVHLSTWGDGGCPILYYVIEYRPASARDWISVANNVAANEKTYVIRDLIPATRYTVRVTAHNHAGSSVATYDVTTLTPEGVLLTGKDGSNGRAPSPPLYQDLRVVIPAAVVVVIVIEVIMAIVCVFRRRKMRERGGSEGMAESPSTAQIQNQQNQHQQYSALPAATPSTQDTNTNKESSGNGTVDGNNLLKEVFFFLNF